MAAFSSQITFLNFRDYEAGKDFVSRVLGLEPVYDIGWAVVYAVGAGAFLGVVDHSSGRGTASVKDGVLISLTTDRIEDWHRRISESLEVSPIREVPDAGLRSFFFTGPEGYCFEVQQFLREGPMALFC